MTDYDYLYYCDADSLIIDYIGNEILGERVATQHIGFTGVRGTPENRPQSLAYIDPREPMQYFAGGFNGGTSAQFLKMSETLSKNIDIDLANGVIARWHDESHMNRYFVDNPPTVILDPGYCFAQGWLRPYKQRILNLQKDNKELHV